MTTKLTPQKQLSIISQAWGRQSGYCFFPWIEGDTRDAKERIQSYHEGPAFEWPKDRGRIIEHLKQHTADDLFWCPSLFEAPRRQMEFAMDEHSLWADLDEVDPRGLDDYPPTIAWETSPGSYQALWITQTDIQGASWPGRENQRLTAFLGADPSGWDTTQLLRIPGWHNHKPARVEANNGRPPQGELLWSDGKIYLINEFGELPKVHTGGALAEVFEEELDVVDRHEVWGRVRLKVSKEVRELVSAKEAVGDRSDKLWQIERDLADAGCTVVEIVAIVRATVWNKFAGRPDELRRLANEASKAVALRPEEKTKELEEERETKPAPVNLFEATAKLKPPRWLIRNVFSEGTCGFIAGQPKSYKSWFGLDLALSISSGMPWLNHFEVTTPGPVLYIQEEDSGPMVKRRLDKVWPGKLRDRVEHRNGELVWVPASEVTVAPPVDAYIGHGFIISDEGWQAWLDETMAEREYVAVVMDPFMMMAGEVDENRSNDMTAKVFRPLKELARKHNCAMLVVHHMKKGDPRNPQRGGQLMLGSVANHAWAEDSIYLRTGRGGDIIVEQESKSAPMTGFKVTRVRNRRWEPEVIVPPAEDDDAEEYSYVREPEPSASPRPSTRAKSKAEHALDQLGKGPHTTAVIAEKMGISTNAAYKQLSRLHTRSKVLKVGQQWSLVGK